MVDSEGKKLVLSISVNYLLRKVQTMAATIDQIERAVR